MSGKKKQDEGERRADLAVRFFREKLRHVEGEFAGQPFELLPWQEKIVRDLFGTLDDAGMRRFRTAYIEVPRKNGKTSFAAGLAIYMLLCDNEPRAQVYSAAGDRAQARICFDIAKEMIGADARLSQETEIYQHRILGKRLNSFYTALSAEAYSKHGYNPSAIIFDEVHVQPTRDLWDALRTGVGARRQPLTIAITTAGHDRSSICWELHQRARAVMEDASLDPSFYPVIYGTDPAEDWTDEEVWRKANPSLGVSLKINYLKEKCNEAISNPEAENTFRNLHLNQWTEQAVRWISMAAWDKCRDDATIEDMKGLRCFAGLDLASTRDVCALALVFPHDDGSYHVFPHFWVPEESKGDRGHQDRRQVLNWAAKCQIDTFPGKTNDLFSIAAYLKTLPFRFDLKKIVIDSWGLDAFSQICEKEGIEIESLVAFGQTISNFAGPSKEFERLVVSGKLKHDGNPVLRWMMSNTAAFRDRNNNIRPDKESSEDKIDGIVATIMALGAAMQEPDGKSIYERENRGFISIG